MIFDMGKLPDRNQYRTQVQCDGQSGGCTQRYNIDMDMWFIEHDFLNHNGADPRPDQVQAFLTGAKWMTVTGNDGIVRHYCPEHTP
jgi:hypothetical protein